MQFFKAQSVILIRCVFANYLLLLYLETLYSRKLTLKPIINCDSSGELVDTLIVRPPVGQTGVVRGSVALFIVDDTAINALHRRDLSPEIRSG